jgi:hypothetical protein
MASNRSAKARANTAWPDALSNSHKPGASALVAARISSPRRFFNRSLLQAGYRTDHLPCAPSSVDLVPQTRFTAATLGPVAVRDGGPIVKTRQKLRRTGPRWLSSLADRLPSPVQVSSAVRGWFTQRVGWRARNGLTSCHEISRLLSILCLRTAESSVRKVSFLEVYAIFCPPPRDVANRRHPAVFWVEPPW